MPIALNLDSKSNQSFSTSLDSYLGQTEATFPTKVPFQGKGSYTSFLSSHRFSNDFDPLHPKFSGRYPSSTNHCPEDKKIALLLGGILLTIVGACLTVKSFQERQHIVSYLADTQKIANGIKQGSSIFGKAINDLQVPIINALSQISTIQSKYCNAKILELNISILQGVLFTVSGSLLIAHHYIEKTWVQTTTAVALCAGAFFGILDLTFRDPRTLSELKLLQEAFKTCKNIF